MSISASEGAAAPVAALYYDGRSASGRMVSLQLQRAAAGSIRLHYVGEGVDGMATTRSHVLRGHVDVAQRLIELPDGASLEVLDVAGFDRLLASVGESGHGVRGLERSWRVALIALLLIAAGTVAFIQYGVPALARMVAPRIPVAVDARIGAESLALLDRGVLKPSALPPQRQQELRVVFASVAAGNAGHERYRIEFRRGGRLGPNAFALPSGIVVLTDELVGAAQNDDELRGVLAHEVGHLVNRHAMRQLLENSASAMLMFALLGDVSSATSLVAGIPALINAAYSRDLEREADEHARIWMRDHGVPPERLGELLLRVAGNKQGGGLLSTHPALAERIGRDQN